MNKIIMPHIHPITGEKLHTQDEFDSLTTEFIDQQCILLRENLGKKRSHKSASNIYA